MYFTENIFCINNNIASIKRHHNRSSDLAKIPKLEKQRIQAFIVYIYNTHTFIKKIPHEIHL